MSVPESRPNPPQPPHQFELGICPPPIPSLVQQRATIKGSLQEILPQLDERDLALVLHFARWLHSNRGA